MQVSILFYWNIVLFSTVFISSRGVFIYIVVRLTTYPWMYPIVRNTYCIDNLLRNDEAESICILGYVAYNTILIKVSPQ